MSTTTKVTDAEREVKARGFIDSILEINREHGVDMTTALIGYDSAVASAANLFPVYRKPAAGSKR